MKLRIFSIILASAFMVVLLIGCSEQEKTKGRDTVSIYAQKCGICHGQLGQGGSAPSHINCSLCDSYEKLFDKINREMPYRDPGTCVDECAQQMAQYIFDELNNNKPAE